MAIGQKKGWAYLDEEYCFNLWNDLGSVGKAHRAIVDEIWINPETGEREYRWRNRERLSASNSGEPSERAVEVAAIRFAIRNVVEARKRIINANGGEWAEDWYDYLSWLLKRLPNIIYKTEYNDRVNDILEVAGRELSTEKFERLIDAYEGVIHAHSGKEYA